MTNDLDIRKQRLFNQRIARTKFDHPAQAAAWMGALQGQDYASARWAVGLRCMDASLALVEGAVAERAILRTWLNRGTLHLTAAADVHWILALLAPRLIASSARRYRQLELDETTFSRSWEVLGTALRDGKRLTRKQALSALEGAGISTAGQRGYHMLGRAALEGLICFGPPAGKQQTFVLLEEWAPPGRWMDRQEALGELARRYFQSHGPATLQDFIWWSGLTAAEARQGLDLVKGSFRQQRSGEQDYWLAQDEQLQADLSEELPHPFVQLLPAFDEYYLGYTDRSAVLDPEYDRSVVSSNGIFRPMIVLDGQVAGIWKQEVKKDRLVIKPSPFAALAQAEQQALEAAARRYADYLGLALAVEES